MKARQDEWLELFRALGEAFLEVLRAEGVVVRQRLERSFKNLGVAAGLLFVAACLFFIVLALALFGLVYAVQSFFDLAPWQAFWAVALAAALVMAVLAAVAWFVFLRRFENPATTAKRRLTDHVAWWRESLLRDDRALPEGEADV